MGLKVYQDGFKPTNSQHLQDTSARPSRYISSVVSVLSLCNNLGKVVELFLVAQMQVANLQINLASGMHTCKEESHHSDFWSTHNHKPKGIKGKPKNIQLLAHDTDGGKKWRKLRGTKTWGSSWWRTAAFKFKKTSLCPVNNWAVTKSIQWYQQAHIQWTTGEEITVCTFMLCSCHPATRINLTQVSKVTPWCSYRSFGLFLFPKNKILQNL